MSSSGGDSDKSSKLGGDLHSRRNGDCVSGSAVVGRDSRQHKECCHSIGIFSGCGQCNHMISYVYPYRGGELTLIVVVAETKSEVGAISEEL